MEQRFRKRAHLLTILAGLVFLVPSAYAASLTPAQISSIVSLLNSFGVDAMTTASVQASLSNEAPTATSTLAAACYPFTRDLTIAAAGEDVRALQQFLNANGALLTSAGPGAPGEETDRFGALTKAALARFQAAHGISPAAGYFGPLTRAAFATLCASSTEPSLSATATTSAATSTEAATSTAPTTASSSPSSIVTYISAPGGGSGAAPVISSIATSTTGTTATITWTTDVAADSTVNYGTSASYGTASTSATLTTSHSTTLTGLTADTTYHFEIVSAAAGRSSVTSADDTFITYSAEAQAFFARLATQPTASRKTAYDTLITGLVNSGVWSRLDGLYLLAAVNSATAKTNLVSSSYGLTLVGTPSFAADAGYTGHNGAGTYLESGFDPTVGSPNFTRDSATLFAWRNTAPADDGGSFMGMYPDNYLDPYQDGKFYAIANNCYRPDSGVASSTGLYLATRPDSTHRSDFLNGSPLWLNGFSGCNSTAPQAGKTMQFLNDGLGRNDGSDSQVSAGGFGSSFTDADSRNISNYISHYLTTIGGGTTTPELLLSSDIVNDGANNETPGFARLADGRLLTAYFVGSGAGLDGSIVTRTSSNNGVSWSSATTILTPAASHTYSEPNLTVLSNGTILLSVRYGTNDGVTNDVEVIQGTVNGDLSITWATPVTIASTFGAGKVVSTSYILSLANGQLMLGLYNNAESKIDVIFSSDSGQTWGSESNVVTNSGSNSFNESNYVQLSNGTIVGVLRNDGSGGTEGYWVTKSTDNGATWSAPTQIFASPAVTTPGRPALSITPSGAIFMMARFAAPGSGVGTGYTYSTDGGTTWSTPTLLYTAVNGASYGMYTYAQGFYDSTTASLLYAVALGGFTAAEVIFQQFSPPT